MDTTKPRLSSKAPHVNNGGGTGAPLDEDQWRDQWRDGGEGERQKDGETKEADLADGTTLTVETVTHHKGSADKQRSNTTGYQRRTKQKVVTDFATVSKGVSTGVKPRTALQALFSQGVSEKSPMPEERGQLDELKQALETFVPGSLKWRWGEDSQGTTLESSWTHIVLSHLTMSKTQRHQQEALWELVHTELTYINKLTVVKELVIAALVNLHQRGFLLEVTPELLFSNLPSILSAHRLFWQEVMYPMLHRVRRTGTPFDPLRLEAGCLQFHERFSCYVPYCWEEESTVEFTRRQMETSPHFLTYLQWVETHPLCERMRMGDMQAKPHQRITKYPLLLKAVLKTSQDPHVQTALRGMLSSVNVFLESVNDYMRLKDEELALSISAQRVEGYEVEGISEEIDKHVREICHFDLTCPIRGVGPGVMRKLLIEESLKIRGRKDSKLEVMALLFSDVLLMTKAQKKAERLKVVRPPLALDRTHCAALKDGCSFVLVEVSELGCAMNVYTFTTACPESCSKWVSTIYQQQETLRVLREKETDRQQLDRQKLPQFKNAPSEAKVTEAKTINQPTDQLREETVVAKLIEEPIVPQSINGMLASKRMETEYQPPDPVALNRTRLPGRQRKFSDGHGQSVCGGLAGWPIKQRQAKERDEWIETGMTGEPCGNQWEDGGGDGAEFPWTNERRVTWNHYRPDPVKPNGPHPFLIGGYPDADYPSPKPSTLDAPHRLYHPTGSVGQSEFQRTQGAVEIPIRRDSNSQSVEHQTRKDSCQSGEEEPPPDVWRFSRKLKSPRLRRRRPMSSHHNVPPQVSRRGSGGSGTVRSALHTNSSSNSDSSNSDCSQKLLGHSAPSGRSSDSPLVLRLGSLMRNRGELWSSMPAERVSPELNKASSEPELPKETPRQNSCKRSRFKAQRSTSTPDFIIQGGHGLHLTSGSRPSRTGIPPSPPLGPCPRANPSALEGLLERAKGRARDQVGGKRERGGKTPRFRTLITPPSPPSLSTTRSPSPSDGDRDTEWEEVALMRHRALSVSQGWSEERVDADEEEKKYSSGVNVDWPGWCFDDEEVKDRLAYGVGDEGLLEGISPTLTWRDFQRIAVHKDGEISQV